MSLLSDTCCICQGTTSIFLDSEHVHIKNNKWVIKKGASIVCTDMLDHKSTEDQYGRTIYILDDHDIDEHLEAGTMTQPQVQKLELVRTFQNMGIFQSYDWLNDFVYIDHHDQVHIEFKNHCVMVHTECLDIYREKESKDLTGIYNVLTNKDVYLLPPKMDIIKYANPKHFKFDKFSRMNRNRIIQNISKLSQCGEDGVFVYMSEGIDEKSGSCILL